MRACVCLCVCGLEEIGRRRRQQSAREGHSSLRPSSLFIWRIRRSGPTDTSPPSPHPHTQKINDIYPNTSHTHTRWAEPTRIQDPELRDEGDIFASPDWEFFPALVSVEAPANPGPPPQPPSSTPQNLQISPCSHCPEIG